jgi:putative PIN family toxin of toxin-antitoxin system
MPLRVVLDTNVLVNGLIGHAGPPRQLLDGWLSGRYTLVSSLYQVQELNHVLSYPRIATRLALGPAELDTILAALLSRAEVIVVQLDLSGVTRDPKDDPLVAAAVVGGVDYLVSGDQDLLELEAYEGVNVITPRDFVEILDLEAG